MLEHRPRRDHKPALRARLTSWIDMMLSPPSAKKLSSIPTRSSPSTSANRPHSSLLLRRARRTRAPPPSRSGAGSALAVELAVRRQRQTLQHHKRRRHHVVRKAATQMRPQRRRIHALTRRRHHIGHQPLAARRILARHHRRLRHARDAAPAPPRSRQARSGTRAASPARPHARGTPAPRPRASAPSPRCGTSGSPQDQTDPPQTAPPSARHAPDSPAPDPHPRCKAPPQPRPAQAPNRRPAHKPACSRSDDQSEPSRCRDRDATSWIAQPTDGLGWPILVDEPNVRGMSTPRRNRCGVQDLAARSRRSRPARCRRSAGASWFRTIDVCRGKLEQAASRHAWRSTKISSCRSSGSSQTGLPDTSGSIRLVTVASNASGVSRGAPAPTPELIVLHRPGDVIEEAPVRDADALWGSGGARGVDDVGGVVRVEGEGGRGGRLRERSAGPSASRQHDAGAVGGQPIEQRRTG